VPLLAPSYKEAIMDLMTISIAVVLVVGLWYVLNKRMDDIESDLETLGKATGKEDLLTKIRHRTQN
jgi:ABC-type Fe3+-hydroxamate transport system substrate-binding protein